MNAMQHAEAHIRDAFRPERKQRIAMLLNGHRVMTLVQEGRYSFPQACRLLEIQPGQVVEAFNWLRKDNARLNSIYASEVHDVTADDWMMKAWFSHEEADLESDVVPFTGSAA